MSSPAAAHTELVRSLAVRAGIALVLMAGFYLLALAIMLGVLWLPYAEWRYADRVDGRLVGFSLVSAFLILVTHGVSRHQELQADALAARVAGAAALASGLRRVHGAALAFVPYWSEEVAPVLEAGFRPPLAAGFSRFLEHPAITSKVREAVETEAREGRADPYDTHPSLRDRLRALGITEAPTPSTAEAEAPAISLLDAVPDLESQLLVPPKEGGFEPLAWEQVGAAVYLPQWEALIKEHGASLASLEASSLPSVDWRALGQTLTQALGAPEAAPEDPERDERFAQFLVGAAIGLALVKRGFQVEAPPGAPLVLMRGVQQVEVFGLRKRIEDDPAGWQAFCQEVGLVGPLGGVSVA